jgi:hypothetical protein
MEVLRKFASLSGLHINVQKSGYIPIAIPSQSVPTITNLLGCQPLKLLITYLGLPLTHSKPTNRLFEPMLLSLQRRLDSMTGTIYTWQVVLYSSIQSSMLCLYIICKYLDCPKKSSIELSCSLGNSFGGESNHSHYQKRTGNNEPTRAK